MSQGGPRRLNGWCLVTGSFTGRSIPAAPTTANAAAPTGGTAPSGGVGATAPPPAATTITAPTPSTSGPPNPGPVQELIAGAPIKAALVNAFVTYDHLAAQDVAGTYPGSVYYAYDPADNTYWAVATVVSTTSDGPLFSQLTARYLTTGPNGHTIDHFPLPRPPQ